MAQIFYMNSLDKLNIKKDSTLMMALTLKLSGLESYILLEEDLYTSNLKNVQYKLYSFSGEFQPDGYYLESFNLEGYVERSLDDKDIIHMRIDPPFDSRYQRYLWMLSFISNTTGAKVVNNPVGIMKYNEKLAAFENREASMASYVGSTISSFTSFVESLKKENYKDLILKPLDLYSGIGVEKVSINDKDLNSIFLKKVSDFGGAIVCQPFIEKISEGEVRAIYFKGREIGSIIKRPQVGEFLANIAQGAKFEKIDLPKEVHQNCLEFCHKMAADGIDLLAFDILDGKINEINITCPGLLVEVSYAWGKNLCFDIFEFT